MNPFERHQALGRCLVCGVHWYSSHGDRPGRCIGCADEFEFRAWDLWKISYPLPYTELFDDTLL